MRLKEGEEEREERVGLVTGKGWNEVEMVSSGTTKEALSQLYCVRSLKPRILILILIPLGREKRSTSR